MKKLLFLVIVLALVMGVTTSVALADKPTEFDSQGNEKAWKWNGCTRIQDAQLKTSSDDLVPLGFDQWGYNYQGHLFNGMYCDYHPVYRPGGAYHDWCVANYGDVTLVMKWNDAWLSNTDCGGDVRDGLLDRHYGFDSYIGSGAWTTNHMWGACEMDGVTHEWDYFVKIVAAPEDAVWQCLVYDPNNPLVCTSAVWNNPDGTEIGPEIWGDFAIIQEVSNDPCGGEHGLLYKSPDHPGFGGW